MKIEYLYYNNIKVTLFSN